MAEENPDCIIIGGGPAGLTAAIYLARFHLSVIVVDEGKSRAALIPLTLNHAGYPEGIEGKVLVARMQEQAQRWGVKIESGRVGRIEASDGGFELDWGAGAVETGAVLIATGLSNRRPAMDEEAHDDALARHLLRYCPICDGFEVTDKRVGVIGTGERGLAEAVFLRSFTADIALFAPGGPHELTNAQRSDAKRHGIALIDGPIDPLRVEENVIIAAVAGGEAFRLDSVYPALGSDIHSSLAEMLGADRSEDGCIKVDSRQRTSVPGLYAAGDVVHGLDQLSHAMGEGAVAATAIRNDLAKKRSLDR